jgi:hypothetical protein
MNSPLNEQRECRRARDGGDDQEMVATNRAAAMGLMESLVEMELLAAEYPPAQNLFLSAAVGNRNIA